MPLLDEAHAHLEALGAANRAFAEKYPGERASRQPVHTVYGGAQLYKAETTQRLGELAVRSMASYGRDPNEFAKGIGFVDEHHLAEAGGLVAAVYRRVAAKLEREAVEDFRIDFEDGFG